MLVASTTDNGKDFEQCPEGTFVARIFQLVDLGSIMKAFGDQAPAKKREVYIGFELLDDSAVRKDGTPFTRGATFVNSLHEKAKLRKVLESIRGKKFTDLELKGFDLLKIMNAYCQVTIVHSEKDGKTYANITSYSPLHKSMAKPDAVNANLVFDLDSNDYMDDYKDLPKWMQDRVSDSFEWQDNSNGKKAPAPAKEEKFEDDVPF